MNPDKRRFIAGAVCPKCGEMDTIIVIQKADTEFKHRECVSCDFKDASDFQEKKDELPTRVNQVNQQDAERSAVQVIKILPSKE